MRHREIKIGMKVLVKRIIGDTNRAVYEQFIGQIGVVVYTGRASKWPIDLAFGNPYMRYMFSQRELEAVQEAPDEA